MENRFILAFVLSLGVFVAWGLIMAQFQPPAKDPLAKKVPKQQQVLPDELPDSKTLPPASTETEIETAPVETEIDATVETAPPVEIEPANPKQLITVSNNGIRYVFSTRGGVLTDIFVDKYRDKDDQPLTLVVHTDDSHDPLTLVTGNPAVDKVLREGHFEPSVDALTLDETRKKGDLVLHLKHRSGLEVIRTLQFEHGNPLIHVNTTLRGPPSVQENLNYSVLWGPGLGGSESAGPNYISFSGPTTFVNNERKENSADDWEKEITHKGDLLWTSFQNKYFAAALLPSDGVKSSRVIKENEEDMYVGLNFESVQNVANVKYSLYIGTKELELLESMPNKLFRLIDYGWFGNKFAFLVKPILKALNFFYDLTGNYGWSIIFLTLVVKTIFFPLTHKSFKSMKGMQKIQPHVKVLQERYKDDRQKMNEEMIGLYRKHKVNPLGGCLPMLLQIPVFIALYHALFFSIELRGAPFMLWIQDLSAADPYYVTPVLMGATMYLQQKLTPSVADPIQQKIFLMMPVVFTFLFITFPSGLVVYWTVNNLLTIAQQYYIYHVAKD